MSSKVKIGQVGEEKARTLLQERGFSVSNPRPHNRYDLLAVKDGVDYGINVKHTTRKGFHLNLSNLSDMLNTKRYVPAFLFISERTSALFTLKEAYWNLTDGANRDLEESKPPTKRLYLTLTHDETVKEIERRSQELGITHAQVIDQFFS